MQSRQLFSVSTHSQGRKKALEWAATRTAGLPQSALYLAPPAINEETVRRQWEGYGSPIALRIADFDSIVRKLHEASTYNGPSTYVTAEQRRWLVEAALNRISTQENPLYTETAPSIGLIEQSESLLTLLEFGGLETPSEVHTRLQEIGVPLLAEYLSEFFAAFEAVHQERLPNKSLRSERYQHVIQQDPEFIQTVFESVETVIVGAFQDLSPLERDLVDTLASAIDTGVLYVSVNQESPPKGSDRFLSRLAAYYDSLGFEKPEQSGEKNNLPFQDTSTSVARSLYRFQNTNSLPREDDFDCSFTTYPTVEREPAALAREIRSLIGNDGVAPEDICVALYDTETYTERVSEALQAADIPVQYTLSRSFFNTTTGKLFDAALSLGQNPDRQEPLCALVSNPLVTAHSAVDTTSILDTARLLESTRIDRLLDQLEPPEQQFVERIVDSCKQFVRISDPESARRALFSALQLPATVDEIPLEEYGLSEREQRIESAALSNAVRVCVSLAALSDGEDTEELRRALEQTAVDIVVGRESNSVHICTPIEAVSNGYEHVFVPGLTTEHTPSPTRRLAFARRLNEAHLDFKATDPIQQTRYTFGILLASNATLHLSAPEQNPNGDPYVLADVVEELQRVTGLEAKKSTAHPSNPATREDIQRSLATGIESGGITPQELRDRVNTYDISVPDAHVTERLRRGVTLAAKRAEDTISEFDGNVSPSVVRQYREPDAPFSPSRLETFASCGFKFYMESVLEIESEETQPIELNALDVGTYIHDVLEQFYKEWTAAGKAGITEENFSNAEQVLYDIAATHLDNLDATQTVFHATWTNSLFDGLTVDENAYGAADGPPGLFKRFLTAEKKLSASDAQPTYFEAHVALGQDDPETTLISDEPIQLPNGVRLRGKIDRIDVTPENGLVTYDYKTGKTPSEAKTLDGLAFQLPVYLLMAEHALDGDGVGGAYYQVNPDSSISYWSGTIGAEEDASYFSQETAEPLRRVRTLEFDSRGEFHEFLRDDVPERLNQIATAVTEGSFNPTVLDAGTAGCEYCDYRDACDVRHHRRHNIQQEIEQSEMTAYIPQTEENNE